MNIPVREIIQIGKVSRFCRRLAFDRPNLPFLLVLLPCRLVPLIVCDPMLASKILPLVAVFVSGVWAQFNQAACPSGFDWVGATALDVDVGVQRSDAFFVVCRTRTPWARIRALLVPCWMLPVVVSVGSPSACVTATPVYERACISLAEYTYPPLNASQYYLPPQTNHSGDVTCDCNTVMYRYGAPICYARSCV